MSRLLLALAIQRAPSLRGEERLLLWDLVPDEGSFAALSPGDLAALLSRRPSCDWDPRRLLALAESDAEWLASKGGRFVVRDEAEYPAALLETSSPPFGLFARGVALPRYAPPVAVVGTRCPTASGIAVAVDLGRSLGSAGIPVISGLARGIDAAAHRGALAALGATCAVLPCGIDRVYPPENRGLAADILGEGGLILSEYPPGTELRKYRFPERNRIIAGLARACIVVEAPEGSGALITADHALGEGRDVWVAAQLLGGPRSAGIDGLASDGAPALESARELLDDWGMPAGCPAYARTAIGPRTESALVERRLAGERSLAEDRRLADELAMGIGLGPSPGVAS